MGHEFKRANHETQGFELSGLIQIAYRESDTAQMDSIGERVKALRERRDLKQGALAKRIGVTQSAISQIESGLTETLRGEVLAGLCRELGAMPDYIMYGKGRAIDHETAVLLGELYRAAQSLTPTLLVALVQTAKGYAAIVPADLAAQPVKALTNRPAERLNRPEAVGEIRPGRGTRNKPRTGKKKVKHG